MDHLKFHKWTEDRSLSESEIPKDPHLPQLAELLDTKAMAHTLQKLLPGRFATGVLEIKRCRLGFIRYKPLHYCRLFYYLDIRDHKNKTQSVQMIGGKVFSGTPSEHHIAKRTSEMQIIPEWGCPFLYLRGYKMLITAFPNDFGIWKLNQLIRPDALEAVVSRALGLSIVKERVSEDSSKAFKILSYKPDRSCLMRFSVCNTNRLSTTHGGRSICGRVYPRGSKELGSDVYQVMKTLWNGDAKHSGLLSIPEPLAYDPTAKILFTEAVGGVSMPTLVNSKTFLDYVRAAAGSLAGIHQTPLSCERAQNIKGLLNDLTAMSEDIAEIFPGMSEKFKVAVDLLRETFPAREKDTCLIHGDFSMNQILVEGNKLHVIDLETLCMGNSHSDIGTFLVRLDLLPATLRESAAEVFTREYESICPDVLNPVCLRWYQAIGYVKSARSSLKQLKPGWPGRVAHYLGTAKTLLEA